MRQIMATADNPRPRLTGIIQRLISDEITSLITLDRFGAIGTFKGDPRQIVIAWPFELKIVDTTGAGDAFGAGVVANAISQNDLDIHGFRKIIDQGRFWAAKACQTEGGSSQCPTKKELESFSKEILAGENHTDSGNPCIPSNVKVVEVREALDILRILDRAYE